jgi:hypothetical protein
MMMYRKCVIVSDANAALSDEEHNASLASVMARFADARSTAELVALLGQARNTPQQFLCPTTDADPTQPPPRRRAMRAELPQLR